jgi:hypothetical protein
MRRRRMALRFVLLLAGVVGLGFQAGSAMAYNPITPSMANQTVVLDGKHLTISQVVAVARYGAKVELSPAARQRSLNAYYLLLVGSREGIPIYFSTAGPDRAARRRSSSAIRSRPIPSRPGSREPRTTGTSCSTAS